MASVLIMGRTVDVDQLVGAAEIAERLGVSSSQTIHVWRGRHHDFPQPITKLKTAMIWYWPEVEQWARGSGRFRSP
jgi:predicted DNA-binding transcriptional regulator AlpA